MALGDPYLTKTDLLAYLKLEDKAGAERFDGDIEDAILSATQEIERHCNRQFNRSETATARTFYADTQCAADVDDFWTTAGLVIESGYGFETTWSANDYELHPMNGVVDGQVGWAFCEILAVYGLPKWFDVRFPIRVTAKWGWAAIPAPVKQAAKLLAAENFKLRDAPLGMAAFDAYQGAFMKVSDNRKAESKLARYARNPVNVG